MGGTAHDDQVNSVGHRMWGLRHLVHLHVHPVRRSPSATALATASVLPNIDSYTTSAFTAVSFTWLH